LIQICTKGVDHTFKFQKATAKLLELIGFAVVPTHTQLFQAARVATHVVGRPLLLGEFIQAYGIRKGRRRSPRKTKALFLPLLSQSAIPAGKAAAEAVALTLRS
jgi:hypothetical protein